MQRLTKKEFVQRLAETHFNGNYSKAYKSLENILDLINKAVVDGESISFTGFGTFNSKISPARLGRNPRTGAAVNIPAKKRVTFKPSKKFFSSN